MFSFLLLRALRLQLAGYSRLSPLDLQAFLHVFFFLSFFFKQFLLKLADSSADCNLWIFEFVLWIGLLIQKKTLVMKQDYWASIGCAVMQSSNTEVTTTTTAAEDCS
jgi:hypothetical protein